MDLPIDPKLLLSQAMMTTPQVKKEGGKTDPAALRKVCQQFEAIFIQQMFKEMRATVGDSGLLEKDSSVGMFQSLMDAQVAKSMAKEQGVGIADALFKQLEAHSKLNKK